MRTSDRELLIFIAAIQTKIEEATQAQSKTFVQVRKELRTAKTMIDKALKAALKDATDTDARTIHNHINTYDVKLVASSGVCKNDYTHVKPVDTEVLERLLSDVISDCRLCCDKSGKEAQQCRRRKDLIVCGLLGEGDEDNDCQFKEGVSL